MPSGWNNQLTRQIGEHLVTAELGKRGYAATPFAGNIPDWDLLVANESGRVLPIQVKAIRGGSWQFDIRKYVQVTVAESEQLVGGLVSLKHPDLICVYVCLNEGASDDFYIFRLFEIQQLVAGWFQPRRLPAKISSFHCAFRPRDVVKFKGRWDLLDDLFTEVDRRIERVDAAPS